MSAMSITPPPSRLPSTTTIAPRKGSMRGADLRWNTSGRGSWFRDEPLPAGLRQPLLGLLASVFRQLRELRALLLAALAVRVGVLLPGPAVAAPALAEVALSGHVQAAFRARHT